MSLVRRNLEDNGKSLVLSDYAAVLTHHVVVARMAEKQTLEWSNACRDKDRDR